MKSSRGGKRLNAGAPKKDYLAKTRSFRLTDSDYDIFLKLGGVKWLKVYLNKVDKP